MNRLRETISIISLLFAAIAILSLTGCAEKKTAESIVATINNYKMTVEDFNYESNVVLRMGRLLGEIPVNKEDVLDALITKEILLQQAQKEGLDKNKDFMKAIELYWEQMLLKNILTKKSKEIAGKISVYENEISDYYNKMKIRIKAKVLVFNDEKSARRALAYKGDVLEYVEQAPKQVSLNYAISSKWYVLGEEDSTLADSIFNVGEDKDRELIKINEKWALVIIEERAPNEVRPLSVLKEEVIKNIKARKEKEAMDEWIEALRSKAHVRINKKIFDTLR